MAKAISVANFIIKEAKNNLQGPVSNLQLQKIMYFLNAIHLVNFKGSALITDAQFEKWDYGPVIHYVYSTYSKNGGNKIMKPVQHIERMVIKKNGRISINNINLTSKKYALTNKCMKFIMDYLPKFLNYSPFELVDYSHQEPQWKSRNPLMQHETYSNKKTFDFYSNPNNCFWNN